MVGDFGDLNLTSLLNVNLAFEDDLLIQTDEGSLWSEVTASDACDSMLLDCLFILF